MRDARRHTDPLLAPFLAMVATLGLICMPLGASPQQTPATQSNPSQQTQTQQPPAAQPDASQQTQTQQPPAAQPDDSTADQPSTPPGVKNAKDDVNKIGERGVGKGVNFYSLEREIALGKQLAQEVERSAKFVDDPQVLDYVNRVGQNLVRNSDARVPFTIKVIDSDQINAFALPGGFFYVFSGLILRADEESELAGVMAHEIAHVCARHGTRNATKAEITQLAM